jgi:hypothetical protein
MSIFDNLFGARTTGSNDPAANTQIQQQNAAAAQNAASQNTPPQQGTNPGQDVNNNPLVPNQNNVPPVNNAQQGGQSPLDQFNSLWQNDPNANQQAASIFGTVDPKAVMQAAQRMDFSKVVPADLQAKIAAGGPEGQAASLQAMNIVAQAAYAQSSVASTQLIEQAISKAREQFAAQIPSLIKQHSVSDTLRTENPAFSNPAVAPLVSAIEQQLSRKFPNATSAELNSMAKQYFNGVADIFGTGTSQQAQQQQTQRARPDTDWGKFLGL